MHEFMRNIGYMFRKMWTWPLSYMMISLFIIVLVVIISISSRLAAVNHLEQKIEVIKDQNAQALQSIQTLTGELKDTKSTIKKLETVIKGK